MKIAILGSVGVPGRYGGFETLAENLVHHHKHTAHSAKLTIWCSAKGIYDYPNHFESANLRYVNLRANGIQSILYDMIGLWQAVISGHDRILLLGTSGALALPLIRLFSRACIFTNIGGIEWKREKWGRLGRLVLRASEWAAVRFSHNVITDNQAISDYINKTYGIESYLIAYGGDHVLEYAGEADLVTNLPERFALGLCRIEPENNIHIILESMAKIDTPLVFVGNWENSVYGRELKLRYGNHLNMYLLDQVYDHAVLYSLRSRALYYIHGHSVGGTNPALVEMMHFGIPIFAHGCVFNRHSTEDKAYYFETSEELTELLHNLDAKEVVGVSTDMREIAQRRYVWDKISKDYFMLLESD
jgi:glycosyltransferase involved in cell wall biosynthesis